MRIVNVGDACYSPSVSSSEMVVDATKIQKVAALFASRDVKHGPPRMVFSSVLFTYSGSGVMGAACFGGLATLCLAVLCAQISLFATLEERGCSGRVIGLSENVVDEVLVELSLTPRKTFDGSGSGKVGLESDGSMTPQCVPPRLRVPRTITMRIPGASPKKGSPPEFPILFHDLTCWINHGDPCILSLDQPRYTMPILGWLLGTVVCAVTALVFSRTVSEAQTLHSRVKERNEILIQCGLIDTAVDDETVDRLVVGALDALEAERKSETSE
jgi:hypothetical protein